MRILILLLLVLITGCVKTYNANEIKPLFDYYCLKNGGVYEFEFYFGNRQLISLTCNDGAQYKNINLGDKK